MVTPDALIRGCASGWRNRLLWVICLLALGALGSIHTVTGAELTLTSMALLPVLTIAWFGGRGQGLSIAVIAAVMWLVAGLTTGWPSGAAWVPWLELLARLFTYGLVAWLASEVRFRLDMESEHAARDPLTGLPNRRYFLAEGERELARARRYARALAVIFIDLDGFKQLNDTRGHATGDFALRETARALKDCLRATDTCARLGGDEFAILLTEIDALAAEQVAHKVSTAVKGRLAHFSRVTASLGLAWFATPDRPFPDMLKAADELMYQVKQSGRGSLRCRRCGADQGGAAATHPEDVPG